MCSYIQISVALFKLMKWCFNIGEQATPSRQHPRTARRDAELVRTARRGPGPGPEGDESFVCEGQGEASDYDEFDDDVEIAVRPFYARRHCAARPHRLCVMRLV